MAKEVVGDIDAGFVAKFAIINVEFKVAENYAGVGASKEFRNGEATDAASAIEPGP